MLRAHDGYQTLVFDEQHFNAAQEEGGAMVSKVSRQDRKILQHNLSLMGQLGGMGTPTLVWRASNGRIKAKSGDPESLAGLFRTLGKNIKKSG